MKHYYVIVNPDKDPGYRVSCHIQQEVVARGGTCQIGSVSRKGTPNGHYTDVEEIPEETEAVLVVGGDGTLIQASRDLMSRSLPMMGINMGTLGYLSEVEASGIPEMLDRLFADDCYLEERMLLQGEILRGGKVCYEDLALNEIMVSRRGNPQILRYRIQVNGQFLNEYDADGVLVATPTGSTAYNLSAGGPIVSPEASLFVVTPVCAHVLNSRSIVLPENAEIRISADFNPDTEAGWLVTFDGVSYDSIQTGDVVRIVQASRRTRLIKLSRVSFLETLRRKMQNH